MQNENHRGSFEASREDTSDGDDDGDSSRCRTHLARARTANELFRGLRQSSKDSHGRKDSRDDDGHAHLARMRNANEMFRGPRQSSKDSRGRVDSRDDDGLGRESCKSTTGVYSIANVSGRSCYSHY